MDIQHAMKRMSFFCCAIALVGVALLPTALFADSHDARNQESVTEDTSDDAADTHSWRRYSRSMQNAINRLDDDPVEALPIPVLFGVDVDDLVENFGDSRGGGSRLHEGLDIMAPEGTPIVSPTEAVVVRVGDGPSSGLYVSTANPGGETFVYMHLEKIADLDEGDVLAVGDPIGYVGNTGNAAGGSAHLHFEIRRNDTLIDPYERLTASFSRTDQITYLEGVLQDRDNNAFVTFLTETYQRTFTAAERSGIRLPVTIAKKLPEQSVPDALPARDLTIGDSGSDVSALQEVLIAAGYLEIENSTAYFGPLTQGALAAYQRAEGILPASGYYGSLTRAQLSVSGASSKTVDEDVLRTKLLAEIERLQALLAKLQASA